MKKIILIIMGITLFHISNGQESEFDKMKRLQEQQDKALRLFNKELNEKWADSEKKMEEYGINCKELEFG